MNKLLVALLGVGIVGVAAYSLTKESSTTTETAPSYANTNIQNNQSLVTAVMNYTGATSPQSLPVEVATSTPPQITLVSDVQFGSAPNGNTDIVIKGTGFSPDSPAYLIWGNDVVVASATANAQGNVTFDTTSQQIAANSQGNLGAGSIGYNIGLTAFNPLTTQLGNSISTYIY